MISLLAIGFLLAACTTAREVQDCSPRERSRLAAHIGPTRAALERNRRQLVRLHMEAVRSYCLGGALSAVSSAPRCGWIAGRLYQLQNESWTLESRLGELTAIAAGMPSSAYHVRFCTPGWQTVRKFSRPAPRNRIIVKKAAQEQMKPKAKPAVKPAKAVYRAEKPVSAAAKPAVHRDAPAPMPAYAEPAVFAPVKAQPAEASVPPAVRSYSTNSGVRVVGPSFLPDLSASGDRPVPVHAPAR